MKPDPADQLEAALLARGYLVENSQDSPEEFGSWYRDYLRRDSRLRLIWDGRDKWFVLQGGSPWRDLATKRPTDFAAEGLDTFLAHADQGTRHLDPAEKDRCS